MSPPLGATALDANLLNPRAWRANATLVGVAFVIVTRAPDVLQQH
jgi:hypothetical protein